ncbi:heme/hemin ABC transporter substrate-binding protein [Marinobacterium litorale]|uniref:heme/hemin ABC transporter substrate-binding protein n=1 Tax=Marinobacterium litorale TaxID=404770 RepID=UPI0004168A0E|nr:ABC transporter substrate-binding protein [Marinobacterium litorale]
MLLSVRMVSVGFVLLLAMLLAPHSRAEVPRVVSTDGATTEILLALGLGQSLVGIDVTSVVPERLSGLPSVGYHRALPAEGVLSLAPDVIVGSEHMGPEPAIRQLEAAGVEVVRLPSADSIETLVQNIQQLARRLAPEQGDDALLGKLREQQARLAQRELGGIRTLFLLTAENRLRLSGSGTTGDALIKLTGAINPADFENYRSVTAETLLAYEPELILVAGEGDGDAAAELLQQQPLLRHTPAGQKGRIIGVDGRTLVAGIGPGAVREALKVVEQIQGQ